AGVRLWRDILGFGAARTPEWYRDQFPRPLDVLPWLKAQEDAVLNAFDPNDYIYQSWAYETHDVGATPGFNGDYAKALEAIRAKTLIMTGIKDLLNPEWEALEAARHIRDVRTVSINPDSITGHMAAGGFRAADVEQINAEVAKFLDTVTRCGARLRWYGTYGSRPRGASQPPRGVRVVVAAVRGARRRTGCHGPPRVDGRSHSGGRTPAALDHARPRGARLCDRPCGPARDP